MGKRIESIFIVLAIGFLGLLMRTAYIGQNLNASAAESESNKRIIIGTSRGKIYDRNLQLLTDNENKLVAAVTPTLNVAQLLNNSLTQEELQKRIEAGYPFIMEVQNEINTEDVRTFNVPVRYSGERLANHVVGYLDSTSSVGLLGIERAYNTFLSENSGELSVTYQVDATGRVLSGLDKTVNDNNFTSKAGVVLTIDKSFQRIAENALERSNIGSGCAVIMHVDTGEILAMASLPNFDQNNVAEVLNEENSPLLNKALQSYAVGSVFKPIIAAAALENGISEKTEFNCKGKIKIGDTTFGCYKNKSHNKINMTKALEESCNTYFVNLIMETDISYLLSLCKELGFGQDIMLAENYFADSGTLPKEDNLKNKGDLANLSFGQGELLASPVQMLKAYHALVTGNVVEPTLIVGKTDYNGLLKRENRAETKKVLSDSTVLKIRKMLSSVVENGNAKNAKSEKVALGGKTGTAQSGIYKNKKEICRTWFCGAFPINNPHYIIVVTDENGEGGNTDCAPVFKEICENILTVY